MPPAGTVSEPLPTSSQEEPNMPSSSQTLQLTVTGKRATASVRPMPKKASAAMTTSGTSWTSAPPPTLQARRTFAAPHLVAGLDGQAVEAQATGLRRGRCCAGQQDGGQDEDAEHGAGRNLTERELGRSLHGLSLRGRQAWQSRHPIQVKGAVQHRPAPRRHRRRPGRAPWAAAVHFDPMKDILGARSSRPAGLLAAALATGVMAMIAGVLAGPAVRPAAAVEGKWTPEQILEHDPEWLRELGLEMPPEKLWSRDGGGLLEAAVKVDGCSAGFLSADGLLITNHHCAFGILQQHSTPERDLITHGFLARTPAEELPGAGVRATIPHRIGDVTAEVEAAVPAGADDLARFRAIERKKKELVAACEKGENRRCQVAAFDGGVRYLLIESLEFPDVRLVYAPPARGGRIRRRDRQLELAAPYGRLRPAAGLRRPGRPARARAEGNVPYRPRHFFPVSRPGRRAGRFRDAGRLSRPDLPLLHRGRDARAGASCSTPGAPSCTAPGSTSWRPLRRGTRRRASRSPTA